MQLQLDNLQYRLKEVLPALDLSNGDSDSSVDGDITDNTDIDNAQLGYYLSVSGTFMTGITEKMNISDFAVSLSYANSSISLSLHFLQKYRFPCLYFGIITPNGFI